MKRYLVPIGVIVTVGFLAGCQEPAAKVSHVDPQVPAWMVTTSDDLTKIPFLDEDHKPSGDGWLCLFNGKDLAGWVHRSTEHPPTFSVTNGVLTSVPPPGGRGIDIYTEETFQDFEIYYEYKVPEGSNSGFYLRGRYEIQILEDYEKPPDVRSNGAIYGQCAPSRNVSARAGEWQSVWARIVGRRITVVLNNVKVIDDFTVTRPTGGQLDNNEHLPGPIMLQGYHTPVEFRRLYLRPIVSTNDR